MLRKMTIGCAVIVAMLAAPATLPAYSMDHFHHFRHRHFAHSITSGITTSITFITSGTTTSLCADPDRNTRCLLRVVGIKGGIR